MDWTITGVAALCAVACSGDAVDTPEEYLEYLEYCGFVPRIDFSANERNRCIGSCVRSMSCSELAGNSRWLAWCAWSCGGDFSCDDGATVISSDWLCDEELDCEDGSDEQCR